MADIEKRKRLEPLFAVVHHSLADRIGGDESAVEIGQSDTNGGILKDRAPSFSLRTTSTCDSCKAFSFCLRSVISRETANGRSGLPSESRMGLTTTSHHLGCFVIAVAK